MKRSPLRRKTPMKRTGLTRTYEKPGTLGAAIPQRNGGMRRVSKKRAKEDREDKPGYDAILEEATRCAVCWFPKNGRRRFDRHHVRGRNCRERNHPHNVMTICDECHEGFHAKPDDKNGLRPCHAVWVQQEIYGDDLDLELLTKIGGKRLEPQPLPEFYLDQRRKNGF